jgi:hypothetical protein
VTDDFDLVPVMHGHLEDLLRVLDAAHGHCAAEDLARGYATMGSGTHRPSNLTRALEGQCDRIRGYLSNPQEEEPDEDRSS